MFADIHSVDVLEDIYIRDYVKMFLEEMNKVSKEINL